MVHTLIISNIQGKDLHYYCSLYISNFFSHRIVSFNCEIIVQCVTEISDYKLNYFCPYVMKQFAQSIKVASKRQYNIHEFTFSKYIWVWGSPPEIDLQTEKLTKILWEWLSIFIP